MKVRYIGPKDRYGLQFPIGVRRKSSVVKALIIRRGQEIELSEADVEELMKTRSEHFNVVDSGVSASSEPKKARGRPRKQAKMDPEPLGFLTGVE